MLSIPVINRRVTAETRDAYLAELRRAGCERLFLFVGNTLGDEDTLARDMTLLRENLLFFRDAGLDVAVWTNGIGHGGALAHDTESRTADFTRNRGLANGAEIGDSFCPLDPTYFAMYSRFIRSVAEAGAPMIMIDDDLRLALHGPVGLGCACERHIAAFNRRAAEAGLTDRTYTREELAAILFTGAPSPLRRLWLDLQGDTLREFAAGLRRTVDEVDPAIRLGHCACLPTWDTDGVDSIELARIFAGNTRPFLRLIGAPYWTDKRSFRNTGLGSIINLERMQLAWCREIAPDLEVFTEGDVYPRPRYAVPSSYLEGFDQVLTAEGQSDGILKYLLNYTHHPLYETGYINLHQYFSPLREQLADAFSGKQTAGVHVFEAMHKLADADCTDLSEKDIICRFFPAALNFTNITGLPISLTETPYTPVTLIFGENAKYADESLCRKPLILDLPAARILTARGIDVGLADAVPMPAPTGEHFPADGETIPLAAEGRFWQITPRPGAEVLSAFGDAPAAYTYENAEGGRFLVYAFDAESIVIESPICQNYCRRAQLYAAIARMAAPLPAAVCREPGIFLLCRRNGDSLAVGIWNFGRDLALPRVELGEDFAAITPIGETRAFLDGRTVTLDGVLAPGCFAGFILG